MTLQNHHTTCRIRATKQRIERFSEPIFRGRFARGMRHNTESGEGRGKKCEGAEEDGKNGVECEDRFDICIHEKR
jgi:hypothetical protein